MSGLAHQGLAHLLPELFGHEVFQLVVDLILHDDLVNVLDLVSHLVHLLDHDVLEGLKFVVDIVQNLAFRSYLSLNVDRFTVHQLEEAPNIEALEVSLELNSFVVHLDLDHPDSQVDLIDQSLDQVNINHACRLVHAVDGQSLQHVELFDPCQPLGIDLLGVGMGIEDELVIVRVLIQKRNDQSHDLQVALQVLVQVHALHEGRSFDLGLAGFSLLEGRFAAVKQLLERVLRHREAVQLARFALCGV